MLQRVVWQRGTREILTKVEVRFLNINQTISAVAAGLLNHPDGSDMSTATSSLKIRSSSSVVGGARIADVGGDDRPCDVLIVGTETNLLAYDVEQYPSHTRPPPPLFSFFFFFSFLVLFFYCGDKC